MFCGALLKQRRRAGQSHASWGLEAEVTNEGGKSRVTIHLKQGAYIGAMKRTTLILIGIVAAVVGRTVADEVASAPTTQAGRPKRVEALMTMALAGAKTLDADSRDRVLMQVAFARAGVGDSGGAERTANEIASASTRVRVLTNIAANVGLNDLHGLQGVGRAKKMADSITGDQDPLSDVAIAQAQVRCCERRGNSRQTSGRVRSGPGVGVDRMGGRKGRESG